MDKSLEPREPIGIELSIDFFTIVAELLRVAKLTLDEFGVTDVLSESKLDRVRHAALLQDNDGMPNSPIPGQAA